MTMRRQRCDRAEDAAGRRSFAWWSQRARIRTGVPQQRQQHARRLGCPAARALRHWPRLEGPSPSCLLAQRSEATTNRSKQRGKTKRRKGEGKRPPRCLMPRMPHGVGHYFSHRNCRRAALAVRAGRRCRGVGTGAVRNRSCCASECALPRNAPVGIPKVCTACWEAFLAA